MRETAKIVCVRQGEHDLCEWSGGNVAKVASTFLPKNRKSGVFTVGGLELRLIKLVPGCYTDYVFVMREGRLARLAWRYEQMVFEAFFKTTKVDNFLYRMIGRPLADGCQIPRLSISYLLYLVSL